MRVSELLAAHIEWAERGAIIRCSGELDMSTEILLLDAAERALEKAPEHICLDLRGLTFADGTVLRVLDFIRARVRGKGVDVQMLEGLAVQRVTDVFRAAG